MMTGPMAGRFSGSTGPEARTYKRDKDGKFATGGSGTPEDLHDNEDTIRRTFEYSDDKTGLSVTVDSIRSQGPGFTTYVSMSIKDRDGRVVGGVERDIRPAGQKTVDHSGLVLDEGFQGQEIGRAHV